MLRIELDSKNMRIASCRCKCVLEGTVRSTFLRYIKRDKNTVEWCVQRLRSTSPSSVSCCTILDSNVYPVSKPSSSKVSKKMYRFLLSPKAYLHYNWQSLLQKIIPHKVSPFEKVYCNWIIENPPGGSVATTRPSPKKSAKNNPIQQCQLKI